MSWTRTKKTLYHTQAMYCCLFTGLHLGPLYHSIRTAFTPHSREKRPSIKLKTSRCHWRAHRKRHSSLSTFISHPRSLAPSVVVVLDCARTSERGREKERKKASNRGHLLTPELPSLLFISIPLFSLFLLLSLVLFEGDPATTVLQCCRWSELWLEKHFKIIRER